MNSSSSGSNGNSGSGNSSNDNNNDSNNNSNSNNSNNTYNTNNTNSSNDSGVVINSNGNTKITTTISLQWFQPCLGENRTVTAYEIQYCKLMGSMKKNINFVSGGVGKEKNDSEG